MPGATFVASCHFSTPFDTATSSLTSHEVVETEKGGGGAAGGARESEFLLAETMQLKGLMLYEEGRGLGRAACGVRSVFSLTSGSLLCCIVFYSNPKR